MCAQAPSGRAFAPPEAFAGAWRGCCMPCHASPRKYGLLVEFSCGWLLAVGPLSPTGIPMPNCNLPHCVFLPLEHLPAKFLPVF